LNRDACLEDSKGNLWFGTVRGVTRYDPGLDRPNLVPPPVYMTRVSLIEQDSTITEGCRLKYFQNYLRFEYAGVCFSSPEALIYHYKLEGVDNDWRKSNLRTVQYTNLPGGRYVFKVKAMNRDGIWSEQPATFSFEIMPPFWTTLWFKISLIAVIISLLWTSYQLKTRYMRIRNEELSREVSERKRAEKELQDALTEVEGLKGRLEKENIYLQEEIKNGHNFEEIIGSSEALDKVLAKVEQVTATDTTVLILGETGTGKELIARALHNLSSRSDKPLVKVNCAALPSNLIENELFGHERGAFTGAHSRKMGRFELADGGTIFLDEIGNLPIDLQAKLLRILQEGEFERLGSSQTIKVDTRLIAATNRNLEKAIANGDFREDLYYRLNVFPIEILPLREHKDDIPQLVNHFVMKYGANKLFDYHWPGNVRELENVIERSVILSRGNQLELGDWLPITGVPSNASHIVTLEENEREHIIKALEMTGGQVSGEKGAAKILGLKSTTLNARMKKLGIKRER